MRTVAIQAALIAEKGWSSWQIGDYMTADGSTTHI